MKYDFSGWATKNDILCTDGRTIRRDAFKHCDGKTVPLVWNHQHNDPENVLGQALLHNEDEGIRAYCSFNETRRAQSAKIAVLHGDVDSLSICANHLKQEGGNVLHGDIKEVSLVLAGANDGAHIDEVIRHGEISEDECVIYMNELIDLEHADEDLEDAKPAPKPVSKKPEPKKDEEDSDDDEADENGEGADETVADVFNTLSEKQKKVVYALIGQALNEAESGEAKHADEDGEEDDDADDSEETVGDIFNTLTEKQKNVVYALIGEALESGKEARHSDEDDEDDEDEEETIYHSENTEGGNEMKRNIFETTNAQPEEVLTHAEQIDIINEARNNKASLRDIVLQHGITDISNAYPDSKATSDRPQVISENQDWVNVVLNGVHHTPFSRIKSLFADLTADAARAKGYLTKGSKKIEEVIRLLKRETQPTTIYKLQKLDRDDVVDITDFDVVAWLKQEMEVMLKAECARAYLIGDGRGSTAPDKIDEEKIRPIWTMEDLFAIQATAVLASTATTEDIAKAVIKAAVKGFDDYDGSGNTVLFIAPDKLSDMLLLEDGFSHRLYKTKEELAAAMMVDKIVPVPPMKNKTRTVTIESTDHTRNLVGIIVDLRDYNVGQTRGGQTSFFDNFDLDFNKMEYLLETRQSGSLVKPKSAIVLEYELGE